MRKVVGTVIEISGAVLEIVENDRWVFREGKPWKVVVRITPDVYGSMPSYSEYIDGRMTKYSVHAYEYFDTERECIDNQIKHTKNAIERSKKELKEQKAFLKKLEKMK